MGAGRLGSASNSQLGSLVGDGAVVLGVVESIPAVSAAATDLNWRLAWYGGQMMAKVVAVWFLAQSPDVIEAFKGR